MLLPVVMALSLALRHRLARGEAGKDDPLMPRFLLVFVAFVVAGSVGLIPKSVATPLSEAARACLVVAIAAVGLKTSAAEMKRVGARAFALLVTETVFLAGIVLAAQKLAG